MALYCHKAENPKMEQCLYTVNQKTVTVTTPLSGTNHCWDISILDFLKWRLPPSCIFEIFSERELAFTIATWRRDSVCLLSVTLVHPTQAVPLFGNFFHHTIAQGLYFSAAKNHWWGTPLSPWNLRSKWPTLFQTAQFRPISAHSA